MPWLLDWLRHLSYACDQRIGRAAASARVAAASEILTAAGGERSQRSSTLAGRRTVAVSLTPVGLGRVLEKIKARRMDRLSQYEVRTAFAPSWHH